jgi:ABC-type branched-subunit amino acid transport system ATPase component
MSDHFQPVLHVQSLSMQFGGIKAVDDVSMQVAPRQVHSLIGPNGSGKSTIINALSGLYIATSGTVVFGGEDITRKKPHERVARGLARTFQNIRLFKQLSVLDNVMVGRHSRMSSSLLGVLARPAARREEQRARERALAELEFLGLLRDAHLPAGSLSYGRQRLVEIGRALATDPRLLLLDEPAAGLNPTETQQLCEFLRAIAERGVAMLLVEHDMNLVMELSDHITVLNFGRRIADGAPRQVQDNPEVISAYLGSSEEAVPNA